MTVEIKDKEQLAEEYVDIHNFHNDRNKLEYCFERAEKHWIEGLREHPAYEFRTKELKKQILDLLNKYRADLSQVNHFKLHKTVNQEARIKLESKIEVLIELQNKWK